MIKVEGYDNSISVNIGPGATGILLNLIIAPLQKFRLTHFGNYVGAISAWGNITWNMYINGAPIPRFNGIKDQIGTQIELRQIGEEIIVPGCSVLLIEAINNGSIAFDVGASLKGEFLKR